MHCAGGGTAYTVFPWVASGLNPQDVANSILIEYCNNFDFFGGTDGIPQTGGMLSNLDSQQLLTYDNITAAGSFNDNDMLTVCNGGQTAGEYRAQFSAWVSVVSAVFVQQQRVPTQLNPVSCYGARVLLCRLSRRPLLFWATTLAPWTLNASVSSSTRR